MFPFGHSCLRRSIHSPVGLSSVAFDSCRVGCIRLGLNPDEFFHCIHSDLVAREQMRPIEQKKAGGAKSTAFWHVCRAENTTTPILDLGAGAKVISAWL